MSSWPLDVKLDLCALPEADEADLPVLLLLASVLDWPAALELLQLALMILPGNSH